MSDQRIKEIISELRETLKRLSREAMDNVTFREARLCIEAADLLENLQREKQEQQEPKPLIGGVRIGQIVTEKIVAADAERGIVSIKWNPYTEPKGDAKT